MQHTGKRKGQDDPRHLWPWVLNAISRLRPKYAILENVRGHLTLGGVSVIGDLAAIGYNAEWRIVSAASVGAPHRRDRIIIVACPQGELSNGSNNHSGDSARPETIPQFGDSSGQTNMANTTGQGLQRQFGEVYEGRPTGFAYSGGEWWETEPELDRVADGISHRVDRLRCLGNAVVPQVAEVIGKMVVEHEKRI